jgi:HK97 family phage major capsid protein
MSLKDKLKALQSQVQGINEEITKALEEDEETGTSPEGGEAPEGSEPASEDATDEEVTKAAEKVAEAITASLPLEKIDRLFDAIEKLNADDSESINKALTKKSVDKQKNELTKEEKILAFSKALFANDKTKLKALSEGTDADGGYLFPNEFRAEIIKKLEATPRMRSLVRVLQMRKDKMDIPREGSKVSVFWGSENTSISTTTADFEQPQLVAYRMNAILYTSRELVDDATELSVVDLIVEQFADAVGQEEDKVVIQGSGSGQPTGIINGTGVGATAVTGNLSFDDIKNLYYSLPIQYRQNAVFLINSENVKELDKLKDSQGRYLWKDPVSEGTPPTLKGKPVYENDWVPVTHIIFGDLKRAYFMGDRQRMAVETSTEAGNTWEKHQLGIKVIERIAGDVVLPQAVKMLNAIP